MVALVVLLAPPLLVVVASVVVLGLVVVVLAFVVLLAPPTLLALPPWHRPPMQDWPAPQTLPQVPQFDELVWGSIQTPPQESCAAFEQEQLPATQLWPAPHGELQLPQLAALLFRSTQAFPQAVRLAPHELAQAPALQNGVGATQRAPQLPQLLGSSLTGTQAPLQFA